MKYRRILLKLSGEVLGGKDKKGIAPEALMHYCDEIKKAYEAGVEIVVVMGGGNMYRGKEGKVLGLKDIESDYIGMLATMMNAVALSSKLFQLGVPTMLMSRLSIPRISEPYNPTKAEEGLRQKRVLVVGGGTGVPCFTTDSAGALTAIELGVDVFIKGTNVHGVYAEDPAKNGDAVLYDTLSLQEALDKKLGVMDITAIMLCLEHTMPTVVYKATSSNVLLGIIREGVGGTLLYP